MCAIRPAAANFLRKLVHAMTVIRAQASDPTKNKSHPTRVPVENASPAHRHIATTTIPAPAICVSRPGAAISKQFPISQTMAAPKMATRALSNGVSPVSAATSNP